MIKNLFVEVEVVPGQKVTVELRFKNDGVSIKHAYYEGDFLQVGAARASVLWENEEGDRAAMASQVIKKDDLINLFLDSNYGAANFHIWNVQPYNKEFFEPGTRAHKQYDATSPFLMHGIGTPGRIVNTEQADTIAGNFLDELCKNIEEELYFDHYEVNHLGHVYGIENGCAVVVRGDGSVYLIDPEQDALDDAFMTEEEMRTLVEDEE